MKLKRGVEGEVENVVVEGGVEGKNDDNDNKQRLNRLDSMIENYEQTPPPPMIPN